MATESNQQSAKITVHWLNKSRAQRVIWLLEELSLDYDIKTYTRDKHRRAPAELKEVHPLGKAPVISIEAPSLDKPFVLAESGPIVEYLCEHFGPHLIPKRYPEGKDGGVGAETEDWINYRYFMHYAEDTNPELEVQYKFMEDFLAKSQDKGKFFLGSDLTAVDFMMFFVLEAGVQHGSLNEKSYPKLYSYVRRMQARDAYQRGGEKVTKASGEKFVPFSEVRF